MGLWPNWGKREKKYEEGEVIKMPPVKNPGSDQEVNYVGELPFPFAVPRRLALPGGLRVGMWVNVAPENRVGILVESKGTRTVVDFVSPEGYTVLSDTVMTSQVTQAGYSQIPVSRRPDPQDGFRMGYVN